MAFVPSIVTESPIKCRRGRDGTSESLVDFCKFHEGEAVMHEKQSKKQLFDFEEPSD